MRRPTEMVEEARKRQVSPGQVGVYRYAGMSCGSGVGAGWFVPVPAAPPEPSPSLFDDQDAFPAFGTDF